MSCEKIHGDIYYLHDHFVVMHATDDEAIDGGIVDVLEWDKHPPPFLFNFIITKPQSMHIIYLNQYFESLKLSNYYILRQFYAQKQDINHFMTIKLLKYPIYNQLMSSSLFKLPTLLIRKGS